MKKTNTILAAVGALLMLTVSSANSIEFKAGVSANGMAAYANAKEKLKGNGTAATGIGGRESNEEAVLATSYASLFLEIASDEMMGLGIGVSYAPEVVDLDKETRHIADATSDSGNDTDGGVQSASAKINDMVSLYFTLPVGETGAYAKAGYIQATMVTEESLATGSKYQDVDMSGYQIGGGYEGTLGDAMFWRAEGSYQMWDDLSANGSEANNTDASDHSTNRITAEVGSVTGSLSIGMKF